ncbi:MAG: hypothetical protein GX774_18495 [Armatimonadetes bacterium]|jgi:3',5'-cyclic AMP phosphodiesterase CpdA|nr:hypothetical protein [Armatimonadota bacterium]
MTPRIHSQTPRVRFAFLADAHLEDAASAAPLRAAIESLNAEPPDFVVFAGDMMDQGTPEQWSVFLECLRALRVPYHLLPGNHDLGNAGQAERWRQTFGPLNSAWEAGGLHCIALDTTNTDPDPENWHGWVEPPAMEWLRATLAAIPPEAPLLLLSHHGLVGVPDDLSRDVGNAAEVLAEFRDRRLLAGFAGHSHRLLRNRWEGIPFYTTPSVGLTRASIGVPPGFLRVEILPAGLRVRLELVDGVE